MNENIQISIQQEIESLHYFFVNWFSGKSTPDDFQTQFLDRFDPEFVLIPPGGHVLDLSGFATSVAQGHGSNPLFRIAIRNVQIRRVLPELVIATYEEWQRNARASTPPDNARIATVVLKLEDPYRWLYVHETWLPAEKMRAGPYDF